MNPFTQAMLGAGICAITFAAGIAVGALLAKVAVLEGGGILSASIPSSETSCSRGERA